MQSQGQGCSRGPTVFPSALQGTIYIRNIVTQSICCVPSSIVSKLTKEIVNKQKYYHKCQSLYNSQGSFDLLWVLLRSHPSTTNHPMSCCKQVLQAKHRNNYYCLFGLADVLQNQHHHAHPSFVFCDDCLLSPSAGNTCTGPLRLLPDVPRNGSNVPD